jgi:Mrp family chromosome partitioning ATPase
MEKLLDRLREMFDYIIMDLPPVNIVSDAVAVSDLISGMILVVREDYTEKQELEHCVRQLELANANVLGCVMNGSKEGSASYGRYKKYKRYKYYKHYHAGVEGSDR